MNALTVISYLPTLGPAIAECLRDASTPVRLAAERCALHVFQLTKGIVQCKNYYYITFFETLFV